MAEDTTKYLVIGGNGFLGRHLVEDLIEHIHSAETKSNDITESESQSESESGYERHSQKKRIFVLDIHKHPDFVMERKLSQHVQFFIGDICERNTLHRILVETGVHVIFHTATPPPFAQSDILVKVNVDATRTLLSLLTDEERDQRIRVNRLVMTSSSSVVYSGQDIVQADEQWVYARNGHNLYTDTKIKQEKLVLQANADGKVRTCCIRPAAVFGPRDELFFPSVLKSAKAKRFKAIIGNGKNMYSFTFVKNVTHAMILAADRLEDASRTGVAGEAFFVTNDEDMLHWEFLCRIVEQLGYTRPKLHVPYPVMYMMMAIVAVIIATLNLLPGVHITIPADFSLDKLAFVTHNRTFRCDKAKKFLGYNPKYDMQEALEITSKYYAPQYHANASNYSKKEQ